MQRGHSLEMTLMLGKIKGQRRGLTEDEMVGWHHQVNGHGFEQTPGDGEEQGSLERCSPRGHKELDVTEQRNKSNKTFQGLGDLTSSIVCSLFASWLCGLVKATSTSFLK